MDNVWTSGEVRLPTTKRERLCHRVRNSPDALDRQIGTSKARKLFQIVKMTSRLTTEAPPGGAALWGPQAARCAMQIQRSKFRKVSDMSGEETE